MKKNRKGFTLIELIIVIVIVGILALVAIPKYFANVEKARKAEALSSMRSIREAIMGYYAATGTYPSGFPITVTIDGEDVMVVEQPSSTNFSYNYSTGASGTITATHTGAGICTYTMGVASGTIGKAPASCP